MNNYIKTAAIAASAILIVGCTTTSIRTETTCVDRNDNHSQVGQGTAQTCTTSETTETGSDNTATGVLVGGGIVGGLLLAHILTK